MLVTDIELFICIWITLVLSFYLHGKDDHREHVRLLGSFSLMLLAIVANEPWLYFVAMIISGLIVASERFMALFVSILRSGESVWEHDNFIRMINSMSLEEVEEKVKEDIIEGNIAKSEDQDGLFDTEKLIVPDRERIEKYRSLQLRALNKYERSVGFKIQKDVKVKGLLLDGLGINKDKRRVYLLEVKIIEDNDISTTDKEIVFKINNIIRTSVPNALDKLREVDYEDYQYYVLMFIIVVDSDRNLDKVIESISRLKYDYHSKDMNLVVRYCFYNSTKIDN